MPKKEVLRKYTWRNNALQIQKEAERLIQKA